MYKWEALKIPFIKSRLFYDRLLLPLLNLMHLVMDETKAIIPLWWTVCPLKPLVNSSWTIIDHDGEKRFIGEVMVASNGKLELPYSANGKPTRKVEGFPVYEYIGE